jgi:histidine triad (HIT) family protein
MEDCIFCKIVRSEIPAKKVFETEDLLGFDDVNPVAPVHVVVVPKKHIATLTDASESDTHLMGKFLLGAKAAAKEKNLLENGYRVVINTMAGAGQAVFHVHMHVLGGRVFRWPPG